MVSLSHGDINNLLGFQLKSNELKYISDGIDTINELGLWSWIKTIKPKRGFMFLRDINAHKLTSGMYEKHRGHSGFTMTWTLRKLETIANKI